jgi:hypothetical protein
MKTAKTIMILLRNLRVITIKYNFSVSSPLKLSFLNLNNKNIELKKIKVTSQPGMKEIKIKYNLNIKTTLYKIKMIIKYIHNFYRVHLNLLKV